jgi:ATPase subunit of ABC transporter with duplicated ATPase domains
MPCSKFIRKSIIPKSFRNEKVKGMFDVDKNEIIKEFDIDIPIEDMKWNIGVIVGSSGTGKTTIAQEVFKDYLLFDGFKWDNDKTIIDNFDAKYTPKEVTEILSKVGFSSPPDWLKPFNVLSNGQKMRVELAKLILENDEPILYDEFTSVVDRQVAQV